MASAGVPTACTMYFTDSREPIVRAYDFDSGEAERSRTSGCSLDVVGGHRLLIDGSTVDADGCYWTTLPLGVSKVPASYNRGGRLMRTIMMPTDLPTCCEFGGPDLDVLDVTRCCPQPPRRVTSRTSLDLGGLFAINRPRREGSDAAAICRLASTGDRCGAGEFVAPGRVPERRERQRLVGVGGDRRFVESRPRPGLLGARGRRGRAGSSRRPGRSANRRRTRRSIPGASMLGVDQAKWRPRRRRPGRSSSAATRRMSCGRGQGGDLLAPR